MNDPQQPAWPSGVAAITLFVDDLDEAKAFYQNVFGLAAFYEDDNSAVVRFGATMVNLLRVTQADELVSPAPVGSSTSGVRSVMTVEVTDVDALCARLVERGVELLNGPMDRPWGIRTASVRDPDGHIWEFAQ